MPQFVYPESPSYYLNVTQQWLEGMRREVPEVTSADKAYAWGREHELIAPRWAWRDQWEIEGRRRRYQPVYQRFEEDERIPRDWMESTEFRYGTPYAYIVKTGEVVDEEGITRPAHVTVTSDVNLSIREILEDAEVFTWESWPTVDPFAYIPTIEHSYYKPEHMLSP